MQIIGLYKIRELFKQMLDIAARTTEEKNSEVSIVLDGIGLVLASDYVEVVSKIFSMLKTIIAVLAILPCVMTLAVLVILAIECN